MSGLNSSLTCDYDVYGRLSRSSVSGASEFDVVYDDRGEVAAATVAGNSETHAYDFIGNEYESNCLNQPIWVPEYGGVWYDTCGRVEVHHIDSEMPAFLLTYDAMHRLASASLLAEPYTLVQSNVYDNVGGHAQAFFESTIKNFENKAAAYLSKNRLSEKEKLKVVSLFYEAYNEDISESGRRASLREKFWYEGNGFNIIDKEDHYEAVFR